MAYSKQNFQDGQILKAANLEKMENGIIAGQGAHNLLDNSDFSNPVNQRGKTSYSNGEYAIDRWKLQVDTNMNIMDGFIRITGSWDAQQILGNKLIGTYTYAICAKVNVAGEYTQTIELYENGSSIKTIFCTAVGEWKIYTCTATFTGTNGTANPIVTINNRAGSVSDASIDVKWAALYEGAYTADTLPPYVPKGKHVEMLNCNVPLAPHNLLDNSDFTNPVNQRGIANSATIERYTYFLDRWSTGNTAGTITLDSNGLIFNVLISQKIDPAILRTGTTVTAAAKFSDGTLVIVSGVVNLSTSWHWLPSPVVNGCQIGLADGTSDGIPYVRIGNEYGKTLVWAALYEGAYDASTLPAYQPKGYAAELAECMRYYQIIPEQTSCAFSTSAQSGKYFSSSINFPQMRITPTISLKTDSNGYIGVVQGVAFVSASEFDFAYKLNGTLLPATTNANYAGKVMSFYGIELNADL